MQRILKGHFELCWAFQFSHTASLIMMWRNNECVVSIYLDYCYITATYWSVYRLEAVVVWKQRGATFNLGAGQACAVVGMSNALPTLQTLAGVPLSEAPESMAFNLQLPRGAIYWPRVKEGKLPRSSVNRDIVAAMAGITHNVINAVFLFSRLFQH